MKTFYRLINQQLITWTELPEIVEVLVQTGVVSPKYVQLSVVGNYREDWGGGSEALSVEEHQGQRDSQQSKLTLVSPLHWLHV